MAQLTHWIPESWRDTLSHLRDEIHTIVERWLPKRSSHSTTDHDNVPVRSGNWGGIEETFWSPSRLVSGSPVVDIDEHNDALVVTAEIPGLDPDDFTVEVTGERLVIRGEKRSETSRSGRGYSYSERRYGAFARALWLPCEVDVDKAQARYQRGVLRITLPKTEHAKATQITVRGEG